MTPFGSMDPIHDAFAGTAVRPNDADPNSFGDHTPHRFRQDFRCDVTDQPPQLFDITNGNAQRVGRLLLFVAVTPVIESGLQRNSHDEPPPCGAARTRLAKVSRARNATRDLHMWR